jgi:hypothetical protein
MDRDGNQTDADQSWNGLYSSQQQEPWQKPWTLRRGIGRAIVACLGWGVSVLMLAIFIAERIFDAD